MSIFSKIMGKIFPANHPAVASGSPDAAATPAGTSPAGGTPSAPETPQSTPTPVPPAVAATTATSAAPPVDVGQVLAFMAANKDQKLNWQTSIVDLMKLLDLDSSLSARKELAQELGYSGDANDSASMNIWLHKQVMNKLAQNGGRVPDELRH